MTVFVPCIGDSQTDFRTAKGVNGFDAWPSQVQRFLRGAGYDVRCRNFGVFGDTSAQVLARIADMFFYEDPTTAIVYIGVNDPGASISTSQTQANIQAIIKALKFKAVADGYGASPTAATPSALPAVAEPGQRIVVLNDNDTTGGMPAWSSTQLPTITGSVAADSNGQKQTVWECRYPAAGVLGWGRVATNTTTPTHVQNILLVNIPYLNFTTGGDTPATASATNLAVRGAQAAAATAEGASVTYVDAYNLMRTMIVGGTVNGVTYAAGQAPNFSADTSIVPTTAFSQALNWHWVQNDQHYAALGHEIIAQAVAPALTPVLPTPGAALANGAKTMG